MSSPSRRKPKSPDVHSPFKSVPSAEETPEQAARPRSASQLSSAQTTPTLGRRFLAWGLEVTILTASIVGPFYLGQQINRRVASPQADLSPTLEYVQEVGARALGRSPRSLPDKVTPLTNLLWSASLGLPLILAAAHVYSLSRSGRSWPKRWMGIQVLALNGQMPGLRRTLLREGVGKWGGPLFVAYSVWRWSGAFPVLGLLLGLGGLALVGESLTGMINRPRRALHDWLAGTCAVDQETGAIIHLSSLWAAEDSSNARAATWRQAASPNSVVINPSRSSWHDPDLTLSKIGLGLGILLTLGGLAGVSSYFLLGRPQFTTAPNPDRNLYAQLVATLTNPELDAAARRAAVLALGNLSDDRVTPLLVDLIAQTDDLLWLDALQQALVARGAEAFPHLRRLNQSLAADLAMQGDPALHHTTILRLQTVNRILTKLLVLEEGDRRIPLNLSRMHLGFLPGGNGEFRLVLKNQDLAGIDWSGSVLTQAQLQSAKFYYLGADGHPNTYDDRTADFSGADLSDANLTGADLSLSQLVNTGLLRTQFDRANLTLANLTGANLEQARLIQATLNQAELSDAKLSKADLTEADLRDANLAGARLAEVNAAGAEMMGANLQNAIANSARLSDADLSNASLEDADLTGAKLQGANLRQANLTNTSFRDADLRGIWLQGAILDQVDFSGAIFAEKIVSDNAFVEAVPSLPTGDQFAGVDFNRARNLDPEQLSFICAQGGIHSACDLSR